MFWWIHYRNSCENPFHFFCFCHTSNTFIIIILLESRRRENFDLRDQQSKLKCEMIMCGWTMKRISTMSYLEFHSYMIRWLCSVSDNLRRKTNRVGQKSGFYSARQSDEMAFSFGWFCHYFLYTQHYIIIGWRTNEPTTRSFRL